MPAQPNPPSFGEWLRRLRRASDLTQERLAEQVGCAVPSLRAIEGGRRRPSREMAERLAEALGLPPDDRAAFVRLARAGAEPAAGVPGPAPDPAAAPPAGAPPLLATKLFAPPPPAHALERPQLTARLHERPARLSLVVAPPGFGKSTLLSLLAARLRGGPGAPGAAWLSLDEQDDDPARFLTYLIAAVRQAAPAVGGGAAAMLRSPQPPEPAAVGASLLNDLSAHPAPLTLFLDDYHSVGAAAIHETVALLVERAPPQLRLVIAGRSDPPLPLARWRARGLLAELRAADLRFDRAEAAAFLLAATGLALSEGQVAALEARTEGWAAGLQLAGLSLQGRADPDAFIAAFGGSHRYLIDYLASEALGRLPGHLRSFLLQTAVLRRMCAPLCDALLGLGAGRAGEAGYSGLLLAELARRNLFLIPLDDEGVWWRYHHLFGEVLRAQLRAGASAAELAARHRRAAAWYDTAGEWDEALHHALAAGEHGHAIDLAGRLGPALLAQGALATLARWAGALPAEGLAGAPRLAALVCHALAELGQLAEAQALLDAAAAQLDPGAPALERGWLAGARFHITFTRLEFAASVPLGHQALELLGADDPLASGMVGQLLANALRLSGDLPGALAVGERAVAAAERAGLPFIARTAEQKLALVLTQQGRLREAEGRLGRLLASFGASGAGPPEAAPTVLTLALVCAQTGRLDEARRHWAEGARLAEQAGRLTTSLFVYEVAALIEDLAGDIAAALAQLQAAIAVARGSELPGYAEGLEEAAEAVRCFAGQGAGPTLVAASRQAGADGGASFARQYARALIALARLDAGEAGAALQLLDQMRGGLRPGDSQVALIMADLIEALAQARLGRPEEAQAAIVRAVALAAPERYLSVLLRVGRGLPALLPPARPVDPAFVDRAIAAIEARNARVGPAGAAPPGAGAAGGLAEPLSARELEVLRLLGAGCSTQQIAGRLVIAAGTVKRHLHSIFGKLGVEGRVQAIARARALGLLGP